MKLSKYLTLQEAIKSNTALRLDIKNHPTEAHLNNLKKLTEAIFEPIREYFDTPIYISSGYRSEALNKVIGGSDKSQHSEGQAFDIDQDNRNSPICNLDIFNYIKDNLTFDQLIFEYGDDSGPNWVHVSYNEGFNRNQILKSTKEEGKVKYIKWNG